MNITIKAIPRPVRAEDTAFTVLQVQTRIFSTMRKRTQKPLKP